MACDKTGQQRNGNKDCIILKWSISKLQQVMSMEICQASVEICFNEYAWDTSQWQLLCDCDMKFHNFPELLFSRDQQLGFPQQIDWQPAETDSSFKQEVWRSSTKHAFLTGTYTATG